MFCKSCGKKIDDDSQFCSYCGAKQSIIIKPTFENQKKIIEQEDSKIDNFKESLDLQSKIEPNKVKNNEYNDSKYDPYYSKEIEATIVGALILALSIFLYNYPFIFDNINLWVCAINTSLTSLSLSINLNLLRFD